MLEEKDQEHYQVQEQEQKQEPLLPPQLPLQLQLEIVEVVEQEQPHLQFQNGTDYQRDLNVLPNINMEVTHCSDWEIIGAVVLWQRLIVIMIEKINRLNLNIR